MDEKTIDTYNKMAKEYDEETSDFWERFPRTFIQKFIDLSGPEILDVGSGPGRDGLLLKEANKKVMCLDASEEMVKLSSARGLDSLVGDFKKIPFPDDRFDGVWSYTALLHVAKDSVGEAIEEIHRVLKTGGVFGLGLIEGDTEEYSESAGVKMPRLFSFYCTQEIERLLHEHGFEILYFESFKPRSKNYLHFLSKKI